MTDITFPEVIDNTMRSTFVSCPQKYFRAYYQGWASPVESIHLRAGGAFAHGIEVARMAYWGDNLPPEEALDLGLRALISHYRGADDQAREEGSAKSLENLLLALDDYFRHYGWSTDQIKPHTLSDRPAVECRFALPLDIDHPETGQPLLYAGRYDMLGVFQDQLFVVDEKTTGHLGPSWANNWPLRSQITGYCWAASKHNIPVAGAIIRGISVQKTAIKHAEAIIYRPGWQMDRWYEQLIRDIQRMINCWKEGYWDWNLADSCSSYGGCPFMTPCLSRDPERWLEASMVKRHWNPLEIFDPEKEKQA